MLQHSTWMFFHMSMNNAGPRLCTTLHLVCLQFLCDVFLYQSTCAQHSIYSVFINFSHCLSCFACNCSLQVRYLASIWKNRGISHKAYPGCGVNVKLILVPQKSVTTQANNDQLTCFTIARCHTVLALTPIEKQSGQQVLYACHLSYLSEWVEDITLSKQYTTCSTTV